MPRADDSAIRDAVRSAYSAIAAKPDGRHPIPSGESLALDLGYPRKLLDELPRAAKASFAGVSCVSLFAELPVGSRVLDLGCGAGLDLLIAARRVGPAGSVVGVDFSDEMLQKARNVVLDCGATNVNLKQGDAESLPLEDSSIDVAVVNGIFNLNPNREAIFSELARVLRKGGRAYAAELILLQPLSDAESSNPSNWFA